ncbi:hypothetical protein [Mycoplasmopsis adleri]|uniref:hypothetical protein n=1 Tax=Mycoplasmopsis adleri TaxID=51362 RepID=UPI0038735EE1
MENKVHTKEEKINTWIEVIKVNPVMFNQRVKTAFRVSTLTLLLTIGLLIFCDIVFFKNTNGIKSPLAAVIFTNIFFPVCIMIVLWYLIVNIFLFHALKNIKNNDPDKTYKYTKLYVILGMKKFPKAYVEYSENIEKGEVQEQPSNNEKEETNKLDEDLLKKIINKKQEDKK